MDRDPITDHDGDTETGKQSLWGVEGEFRYSLPFRMDVYHSPRISNKLSILEKISLRRR